MGNENTKMFRSVLGGFHREDVTNYIKESDRKHADALAELKKQVDDTEQKKEELRKSLDELQTENTSLTKQIEDLIKQYEDMGQIASLEKEKTATLTETLEQAEAKIIELEKRLELSETKKIEEDPNDHNSSAYKLAMYDKISSQLGDILINANRNAEDILTAAREEADKMRTDAEIDCTGRRAECDVEVARTRAQTMEEAAYIRERIAGTANSLLSAIGADLHGSIDNCIREMNSCIVDMQYELQAMLAKISGRSEEMNDRISYYQGCVSDEVEKKLSEMDVEYGLEKTLEDSRQTDGASAL